MKAFFLFLFLSVGLCAAAQSRSGIMDMAIYHPNGDSVIVMIQSENVSNEALLSLMRVIAGNEFGKAPVSIQPKRLRGGYIVVITPLKH